LALNGIPKAIMQVKPYVPGKTIEEVQRELGLEEVIKLGSNENPYGPFDCSIKAMQEELVNLNLYPDASFVEIKQLIGDYIGVPRDYVAVSHGAEGMLETLVRCFVEVGDQVIIPSVTYGLYSEISRVMGAEIKYVPLKSHTIDLSLISGAVNSKTKLIWLCNPNNPTGTIFTDDDFKQFMQSLPDRVWVVVDEAYAEFVETPEYANSVQAVLEGKQVVVVRTFSKAFGLAGARLGYALAAPEMISIIDKVSEPFNANRIGLAGAKAILSDRRDFERFRKQIISDRSDVAAKLKEMGLEVITSNANFIFFQTPWDGRLLAQNFLRLGIIVRPTADWGLPNGIRVTVGRPEENEKFIKALRKTIETMEKEV